MGGFKKFMMRGNVVDMAVGVIIGGAVGAVGASLAKDHPTPFLALVVGKQDFSKIQFQIGSSAIGIGLFINAVIAFLLVAASIYFFVVLPMNAVTARMTKPVPPAAPTTKKCKECLSAIPLEAKRCAFCTQPV